MLIALLFSLALNMLGILGVDIEHDVELMLYSVDFDETLLHGMPSFLLFAGALHVKLNDLAQQRGVIAVLATAGVIAATFIIGRLSRRAFHLMRGRVFDSGAGADYRKTGARIERQDVTDHREARHAHWSRRTVEPSAPRADRRQLRPAVHPINT